MTTANLTVIGNVLFKRGNTTVSSAYTGVPGEIIIDTTLHTIRVQDGVTAGGTRLATHTELGTQSTLANANAVTQTTEINSLRANITAANAVITSLQSNAAIQATLLDTLTGNAVTQSQVLDTLTSNAATQANTLSTLLGNAITQQTSLIDLLANAATQAQAIASVTGTYSNANVATYLSSFDGNIIPAANITYSLGSETRQWKDLWVSNNTIYIGNTPVRVDGNTLLINGAPVGGAYGNTQVASYLPTYTGNITAGNIGITGGSLTWANASIVQTSASDVSITGDGQVTVRSLSGTYQWTFGSNGNLTLPGSIIGASTIELDNRAYGNSADINLYAADDILLQARDRTAGSTTEGGDINIYAGDSAEDSDSSGGDINIFAGDGGAANVDFGGSGGFITIRSGQGGAATGNSGYSAESGGALTLGAGDAGSNNGNIDLGAAGGDVYIGAGDSTGNTADGGGIYITSGAAGTNALAGQIQLTIPPSDSGSGGVWIFDGYGNLTAPGNISASGNISGAYIKGNGSGLTNLPAPVVTQDISSTGAMSIMLHDGTIKYNNYATVEASSGNITGGNILTSGLISAIGNITAGNISTTGNISTGIITLTNGAVIKDTAFDAIAFGQGAGQISQDTYAVAIGTQAGYTTQNVAAVAVGPSAGQTNQGASAVAIGSGAGVTDQSGLAVAIGQLAGSTTQGVAAVAIGSGAGRTSQGNYSIILNATGANLNATTANTFTVAPVRNDVANVAEILFYNTTSKEVTYGNTISIAGNINAGQFNFANGVNILSTVAGTYGNTQVAAYLPTYTGNIAGNIVKNGNVWTFGTNGTTTFPTNISVDYSGGNVQFPRIIADSGKAFSVQAQGNVGSAALSWTVDPDAAGQYAAVGVTKGGGDNLAKVVLQAQSDSGDAATAKTWVFNQTGNLRLPLGGNISEVGGLTGAIRLTPAGGANSNQALVIYPTAGAPEGDHIHLTAGGGATELYLGNDFHYVKLVDGGNIELRATTANVSAQASWEFDTTGNVDARQALGIKIPNGVPTNVAVINSTTGSWEANPNLSLATTGGSGTGLTVNVAETGGYASTIEIATAGTGYNNGDLITVTSGTSNATFTIVIAGRNTWRFGTDANLTLPETGYLRVGTGIVAGSLVASPAPVISGFSSISAENFKFSGNGVNILSNLYANAAVQSANIATINNTLTSTNVAIGYGAGQTNQGGTTVAVGSFAGMDAQGLSAVAIGFNAGQTTQGIKSVAIGMTAGYSVQGNGAVAIGDSAGYTNQGVQAIAIGRFAGLTNQANNTIILNATGANLNATTANTFTVAPVRNDVANVAQVMFYNTTSKEVTYGNTISVAGNINAAQYNFANGVNILSTVAGTYANANVASYLLHFDGDIEFTSSTAKIGNVDVITVMDNIQSPAYRFSNGVNILSTVANTYLPTYSGNVSAVNFVGAIQAQVGSSFAYATDAFGSLYDSGQVFLPSDTNSNAIVAGYTIVGNSGAVTLTVTSATFVAGTPNFVQVATTPTASSLAYPVTVYSDNYSPALPTSTITVGNATVTGNITAGNVAGTTLAGNLSGRVLTAIQAGITTLGTLTNVNTSGNVNVSNTVNTGAVIALGNVNASNTVNTNAAIVNGNITAGNISVAGRVTFADATYQTTAWTGVANTYVALGTGAGGATQSQTAVAIGVNAGNVTQDYYTVAIGIGAGRDTQLAGAIAIGAEAGGNSQGTYGIAIGFRAGRTNQASNTIILNATGANLNATTANTLTVAPIQNTTGTDGILQYNNTTKEVSYSSTLGGNLTVTGNVVQNSAYYETYANVTNSGGNLTCNFVNGATFYATLTANVTANFTNVVATAGRVTGATLIVDQGATAYRVANIQINGGGVQTIKYAGGTPNTGTASNTDVMSFSLISLDGTNWRVLGQISNYG